MSDDSARCSECIKSRKTCDGTRVASACVSFFIRAALFLLTVRSGKIGRAREETGA